MRTPLSSGHYCGQEEMPHIVHDKVTQDKHFLFFRQTFLRNESD